jgi:sulfoxide reductase heme-binding subunit YedZ
MTSAQAQLPASRLPISRLAKWGIGVAALLPALRIGRLAILDRLGPNPIESALNRLGFWTLVLLLVTLAPTPIQVLTGWKWPLRLRRMLGLETFLYACLHFALYAVLDQGLDLGEIGADIVKRKFITVGLLALLLLAPLAVTSTDGWVRRLGFKRWKRLHRLVYAAAALGVIHFAWRVKSDLREPAVFGVALAVLLAIRFFVRAPGLRAPGARRSSPRSSG